MIRMVALLRKKDGITREQFIHHYENSHVPLIMEHFASYLVEYRRIYLDHDNPHSFSGSYIEQTFSGIRYDVVTINTFRDEADLAAFYQAAAKPGVGDEIAADEAMFLDSTANQVIITLEENVTAGGKKSDAS